MPGIATRPDRGRSLLGPALSLIHAGRAPTRSALTAALGVTRATAGAVAAELQALGLIGVDTAPGGAAGALGRPSHRLMIDPDGPVALAAQIHPDGFQVALVGLGGQIAAQLSAELGGAPGAPERALAPVAEAGARLLRSSGRACVAAGLAVPSAVAEPEGTAVSPLYVDWPTGTPIRDIFARQVARAGITGPGGAALRCWAANDINAAALAEHRHGAGRDAGHLLVIATGHRGVGGALVVGGALYTGSTGLGMEAGHVSVDPAGRPCRCGSRGCLDVETDALSFMDAAGRVPSPGTAVLAQAIAILRGEYAADPAVRAAAASLTERLGLGLAGLINVLNPDRILLGGLHRYLLEADPARLGAAVAKRSPWGRGAAVPLLPCALDDGGLIGAAELAWQPVLEDPAILVSSTAPAGSRARS
ncbi:MAG: ROK family protein [Streptosporangiaceae bacterium]|nr:ROK family protein [Streptosporangiaceae bacterium]